MILCEVEEKWCARCEVSLPASQFSQSSRSPDGLWYVCRSCRAEMRKLHKKDPRQTKDRFLRWRYGIGIEEFEEMMNAQGGACAICKKDPSTDRALDVDHDHSSGFVRGLLCNDCNRAIGLFGDDPSVLVRAAHYLAVAAHEQEARQLSDIITEVLMVCSMGGTIDGELIERMKRVASAP